MKRDGSKDSVFAVLVLFPLLFPLYQLVRIVSGPPALAPLLLPYGILAAEILIGALLLIFLRRFLFRCSKILGTLFSILGVPASWAFHILLLSFILLCGGGGCFDSGPFTDSSWTVQLQRESVECGRGSKGPLEDSLELRFRLWKSESTQKNWMERSWNGQWNIETNNGQNYQGSWSSMDGAIQLGAEDKSRLTVFGPSADGKSLVLYSPLGWDDPCRYRGIAAPVHD